MTTLCGDTCCDPKLGNHTDLGSTSFALRPVWAEVRQHRKSGVLPVREGTSSIYIHLIWHSSYTKVMAAGDVTGHSTATPSVF